MNHIIKRDIRILQDENSKLRETVKDLLERVEELEKFKKSQINLNAMTLKKRGYNW